MSGKEQQGHGIWPVPRIIPTGVGKRMSPRKSVLYLPDHPHGYEEKFMISKSWFKYNGSSPRMWGKEKQTLGLLNLERIIPTDVGKRTYLMVQTIIKADHPHGCGEKSSHSLSMCDVPGSSPRMWGKAPMLFAHSTHVRIIPTDVGKRTPVLGL